MYYVQTTIGFLQNMKVARLARDLGIQKHFLVTHFYGLWADAWHNAPDGNLSDYKNQEIADAMFWTGDPDHLVQSLIRNGFLEETEDGLLIHDWFDHTGKILKTRVGTAKRVQEHRDRKKAEIETALRNTDVTVTAPLRNTDVTVTAPLRNTDVTNPQKNVTPHIKRTEQNRTEFKTPIPPFENPTPQNPDPDACRTADAAACAVGSVDGQISSVSVESPPEATEAVKEPEKPATRKSEPKSKLPAGSISVLDAAEAWNALKPRNWAAVNLATLNSDRKAKIESRIREFPTAEQWKAAIGHTAGWPHAHGTSESGWVANFDWLISSKGRKAFEGKLYVEQRKPQRASAAQFDHVPTATADPTISQEESDAELRAAMARMNAAPHRRATH